MSNLNLPSAEQVAASRATLWHHDGRSLLTVESMRAWLSHAGLVLYTPRAQQLPAPAPSFVETVLGAANPAPTLDETQEPRTLLARMIAEGSAVPLNLLGTTTETPDYICSAAVFSYIFTLRGDKAWKQPPATQGAVKVSPLALATYEVLARRVSMSAAELVNELGKEVTETAVLRGLSELWSHLRVMPVPQVDGPTLWELMSTRFTKQIKAGANAGQPSALSALISLYLGMSVVATEEEIETILSPLASRSRIRDVVHALIGARQLETIAIDGRTVVHISGDLPAFAVAKVGSAEAETAGEAGEEVEVEALGAAAAEDGEPAPRITKFVAKPRKVGTGSAKKFTPRTEGERERRPFVKKSFDAPAKPTFTKPWDEDRPARAARPAADGDTEATSERPSFDRAKRPAFGSKPSFGSKPGFSRNDGGIRPTFRRDADSDASAPPRREYTPRPAAGGDSSERPPRKTFSKPGTFGRKREESAGRPSYGSSEGRPPRREFTSRPPSGDRPARPYSDRPSAGGRPPFAGKPAAERRPGSYSARPQSGEGFASRKPYTPRSEGSTPYPKKPFTPGGKSFSRPGFPRDRDQAGSDAPPRKVFRKFDAPRFDKPRAPRPFNPDGPPRSDRPQSGGFSKPGFGGKKPFSKPGSKPPGTFAKFADGNKPFRKPGPGGKKFGGPKPGGKSFGGAARPEYRKRRPEEGETA